jgi:hypothetical protein
MVTSLTRGTDIQPDIVSLIGKAESQVLAGRALVADDRPKHPAAAMFRPCRDTTAGFRMWPYTHGRVGNESNRVEPGLAHATTTEDQLATRPLDLPLFPVRQ